MHSDKLGELPNQVLDILLNLKNTNFSNQRLLAENTGMSLGFVNKAINTLEEKGFISSGCSLTTKAKNLINSCKPKRAVILAAGFSMRLGPINLTMPAALLEIKGEVLIEHQIQQLHQPGRHTEQHRYRELRLRRLRRQYLDGHQPGTVYDTEERSRTGEHHLPANQGAAQRRQQLRRLSAVGRQHQLHCYRRRRPQVVRH